MKKAVRILGTRGIPAGYSGFESFAENLALGLVPRGWDVTVYCQQKAGAPTREDTWQGVRLVHLSAPGSPSAASVLFDLKCTLHAARHRELALVLGYNTALFSTWYHLRGVRSIMNMDGMDRLRPKWRFPIRQFFAMNERLGPLVSDHLVADHPAIADYLATRVDRSRITTIPYGAERVDGGDPEVPRRWGLEPGAYVLVVCRPETGHSIGKIVRAFSRRPRGFKLALLGDYEKDNSFHRAIRASASSEVVFPGGVYQKPLLQSLRVQAALYIHGHRFGGTNPSLVEALGAGSPVLARDNHFNRWVAGESARYFRDEDECAAQLDQLLPDAALRRAMSEGSRRRHAEAFTPKAMLDSYEELLLRWLPE